MQGDSFSERADALLVLADGEVFEGEAVGAAVPGGVSSGEIVFNTVLSGYQEVVTDPSYAGQVVAFTYPHIGSYGVTPLDDEARRVFCRGVVVRDLVRAPSSWRATGAFEDFLGQRRRARHLGRRYPTPHAPHPRARRHGMRLRHRARVRAAARRPRPNRARPGATSSRR